MGRLLKPLLGNKLFINLSVNKMKKILITILLIACGSTFFMVVGYLIALKMWNGLVLLIGLLIMLGLVSLLIALLKFVFDLGGVLIKETGAVTYRDNYPNCANCEQEKDDKETKNYVGKYKHDDEKPWYVGFFPFA